MPRLIARLHVQNKDNIRTVLDMYLSNDGLYCIPEIDVQFKELEWELVPALEKEGLKFSSLNFLGEKKGESAYGPL